MIATAVAMNRTDDPPKTTTQTTTSRVAGSDFGGALAATGDEHEAGTQCHDRCAEHQRIVDVATGTGQDRLCGRGRRGLYGNLRGRRSGYRVRAGDPCEPCDREHYCRCGDQQFPHGVHLSRLPASHFDITSLRTRTPSVYSRHSLWKRGLERVLKVSCRSTPLTPRVVMEHARQVPVRYCFAS